MERLTDPAQGYCEMYCKKYGHCFGDPGDCIFEKEIAMYDALKSIEGIVPFDRLLELALADKEERLVALPCKVGDTVYKINHGDYAHHWKPFVQEGTVTEISCKNNRSGKALGFAIIVRLNYEARVRFKFSNIGKTVFLTREEAEAALAGERKDGEG